MRGERSCLLLLNGELRSPALVKKAARRARGVICCDGGARHAAELGLEPDFIVGDMDSLPRPLPSFKRVLYFCDFDVDRSDFEKGLELARELGCRKACVAGAVGGRLDHTLVNLALIERYSAALDIELLDGASARLLGPGRHALAVPRGRTFSLLAAPKALVTLSGARYALSRAGLVPGSRGLSNVSLGAPVLTVHEGRLWVLAV